MILVDSTVIIFFAFQSVVAHPALYLLCEQSSLLKTVVSFSGHDDLVQNSYAEDLGGLDKLFVNLQVGVAGLQVTGGVVVGEDDGGGPVGNDIGEDLAWVDLAPVQQADCDDSASQ